MFDHEKMETAAWNVLWAINGLLALTLATWVSFDYRPAFSAFVVIVIFIALLSVFGLVLEIKKHEFPEAKRKPTAVERAAIHILEAVIVAVLFLHEEYLVGAVFLWIMAAPYLGTLIRKLRSGKP